MNDQNGEKFELDFDDPANYLHRKVLVGRARTGNILVMVLIGGLVSSVLLYTLTVFADPAAARQLDGFYEKWFQIMSPLAGTAIGYYFGHYQEWRR